MKKGIIIFLISSFYTVSLFAQNNNKGPLFLNPTQSINSVIPNGGNSKFSILVGLPFLGKNDNLSPRLISPVDIRNPWGILYLSNTFENDYLDRKSVV